MPKLVNERASQGAASAAVLHSSAAGASAHEAVVGSTLMMSAAVMAFARLIGAAAISWQDGAEAEEGCREHPVIL